MAFLVSKIGSAERIKVSRSAVSILDLLKEKKSPLAVKAIREELSYSERTIHYALRQLRENALIMRTNKLQDLRESYYLLTAKAAYYGYHVR